MTQSAAPQEGSTPPSRPLVVSLVAILIIIGALLALIIGSVTYSERQALLNLINNQTAAVGLGSVTLDTVSNFAFILIGYGAFHLAIAWGLWMGQNWARIISMILSILGLISFLPAITLLPEIALPVVVFAGLVLYYFTRPRIKEFFKYNSR